MSIRHLILTLALLSALWLPAAESEANTPAIPWKLPVYSYTAREANVSDVLIGFAAAEGIGINLPKGLATRISGAFQELPAGDFLERVCAFANLVWYYDGASLFICRPDEMTSILLELRYMKADDVIAVLRELQVEDPRFPITRTFDNELIKVSGPPRYLNLIQELVVKADRLRRAKLTTDEEIRIFKLKHAWAEDTEIGPGNLTGSSSVNCIPGVATLLKSIMAPDNGKSPSKTRHPGDTPKPGENEPSEPKTPDEKAAADLLRDHSAQPTILADKRLNAVIVRDVKSRMSAYAALIEQLDVPVRMVEIAVTVLDISKDAMFDWELRLKALGAKRKWKGGAGLDVDNLQDADNLAGLGLAGAVSYLTNSIGLSSSIAALEEKGKARTVSRPSVLTLDNVPAQLQDTRSYQAKIVGKEVVDMREVSAGIVLTVQPRIVDLPPRPRRSENEPTPPTYEIWMLLNIQDGGFEDVVIDDTPMSRNSTLDTQAGVQEGQSLLIGGYMHENIEEKVWGIPYLRDIPWIGWLFGGIGKSKTTVQRMFLVTPRVITFGTPSAQPAKTAVILRDTTEVAGIEDEIRRGDYYTDQLNEEREKNHQKEDKQWREDRRKKALREQEEQKILHEREKENKRLAAEDYDRLKEEQRQEAHRLRHQREQEARETDEIIRRTLEEQRRAQEAQKQAAEEARQREARRASEQATPAAAPVNPAWQKAGQDVDSWLDERYQQQLKLREETLRQQALPPTDEQRQQAQQRQQAAAEQAAREIAEQQRLARERIAAEKRADAKPADAKPADAKPADAKPADAKPAEATAWEKAGRDVEQWLEEQKKTKQQQSAVPPEKK